MEVLQNFISININYIIKNLINPKNFNINNENNNLNIKLDCIKNNNYDNIINYSNNLKGNNIDIVKNKKLNSDNNNNANNFKDVKNLEFLNNESKIGFLNSSYNKDLINIDNINENIQNYNV